jgi:hypothetical protein
MAGMSLILSLAASLAWGYEVVEIKDGGALAGMVKFAGEPPKQNPIPVKKNRDICGDAVPSEALVLGPNKGVRHTVVWIEGITKGKKPDTSEVVLDNAKCLFAPHATATIVRGKAKVRNSDPILHNTHGFLEKATVFNLALPNQDQAIDISGRIRKPGVVDLRCDAHGHMRAWLVVRDHPYFAVTDENGNFKISDIPPGKYKVVAWHESWKVTGTDKDGFPIYEAPITITKEVTIPAKGEAKVTFEFK